MLKQFVGLLLCLLLLPPFAQAFDASEKPLEASDKPLEEKKRFTRWYFSLGPYWALLDTDLSVGINSNALGLTLDVEKLLGLETQTFTFRIDGAYRAGRNGRHRVGLSWFAFYRTGENTLAEDVELPPDLGGGEIPIGTTLEGKFNIDIIKATYRYSIILDDRIDLNVGGGLYIAPVTFGVGVKDTNFEETSLTAPLPVVGLGLIAALTPRWYVMGQADLMYLEIGNYKGGVQNNVLGVEYRPFKKVGFGLRAESLKLRVEVEDKTDVPGLENFIGDLRFKYVGGSVYMSVFF